MNQEDVEKNRLKLLLSDTSKPVPGTALAQVYGLTYPEFIKMAKKHVNEMASLGKFNPENPNFNQDQLREFYKLVGKPSLLENEKDASKSKLKSKIVTIYVDNRKDGWMFTISTLLRKYLIIEYPAVKRKYYNVFLPHLVRQKLTVDSTDLFDDLYFIEYLAKGMTGFSAESFKNIIFKDKKTKAQLKNTKSSKNKLLKSLAISKEGIIYLK